MKITRFIFAGVAAVSTLASCSKDFLETAPTDSTTPSNLFADINSVQKAITGLVYNMQDQQGAFSQGCCGENFIISRYGEFSSPYFSYPIYQASLYKLMNGENFEDPTSTYSAYAWAYYYKLISNANSIIMNVDKSEGTAAEKAFYKAQALTYRAYAYTKLIPIYCVRWKDSKDGKADGVCLRLDESTGDCALSTMEKCYEQIYADCNEAIKLFTESGMDRDKGSVWYTNINVAYAVLAKAALDKEDYQTALDNAKLARNGYALMSNAEYKAGFFDPNGEWIFGSASVNESTDNMWYWTFGTQFGCNGYYAAKSSYGTGNIDYIFIKTIPDDDVRKQLFITPDKFTNWDDAAVNQTTATIDNSNTALCAEIKQWLSDNAPAGSENGYAAYKSGIYYLGGQIKFWVKGLPGYSSIPYIRASEMVLIEAEANYFLKNEGDAQKALEELNATRQAGYSCTATGTALFDEIVKYRELELWGEGFGWFDYKRWKKDIVRVAVANGGNHHANVAVTVSATKNDWKFVIPEIETLYNGALSK